MLIGLTAVAALTSALSFAGLHSSVTRYLKLVDWCCSFTGQEIQHDAKMVSYKVVDQIGKPYFEVEVAGEHMAFSLEEISTIMLSKMKLTAGVCAEFLVNCMHSVYSKQL